LAPGDFPDLHDRRKFTPHKSREGDTDSGGAIHAMRATGATYAMATTDNAPDEEAQDETCAARAGNSHPARKHQMFHVEHFPNSKGRRRRFWRAADWVMARGGMANYPSR
jgi:hypothetical protein